MTVVKVNVVEQGSSDFERTVLESFYIALDARNGNKSEWAAYYSKDLSNTIVEDGFKLPEDTARFFFPNIEGKYRK